jgi:hypothetical protein
MAKPKFKVGDRVWFLKSVRLVIVLEVIPKRRPKDDWNYIVERVDNGKQLYATEDGLSLLQ